MDDLVLAQAALFKVLVEQRVVVFGGRLGQVGLHIGEGAQQLVGDGGGLLLRLVGEAVARLFERVHIADHLVALHQRDLDGRDLARVLCFERVDGARVVGVFFVHAVDEQHHRDLVFQALVDRLFRPDGQCSRSARHDQRAARGAQRLVLFPFKVVKPGHVQQIQLHPVPHGVGHGERNTHLARDLLLVVVGHRRALGHFAEAVGRPAVE